MVELRVDLGGLTVGRCRLVQAADGRDVAVVRTAQGLRAMAGICPHQHLSLDGARVVGGAVMCPHHGARFDLETGQSRSSGLTARPLPVYPVREEGGQAIVTLPETETVSEGTRGMPGSAPPPR